MDLLGPFERLLDANPGESVMPALDQAGYLDALRELPLGEVEPLLRALGARAVDAPVADTMAARAVPEPSRALLAVMAAAEMAGTGERLLAMSLEYASTREQFGRPIGKFQAIQQQLAVMAEQVMLTRIIAQSGCARGLEPPVAAAAVAKSVASSAAPVIAAIAHAIHGAIGITAEFPLHRLTARLHALRWAHGSESYWNRQIGRIRIEAETTNSLDFIRSS
jgi:alkylation response protein AidB-like acyl-CoA dehydrogenase